MLGTGHHVCHGRRRLVLSSLLQHYHNAAVMIELTQVLSGLSVRRLYVNVITTIKGYGEFLWVDVVEQIDSMTEQVNGFQAQCKKLPKVSCFQRTSTIGLP